MTSAASDPNSLANELIASLPLMVLMAAGEAAWLGKLALLGMAAVSLYAMSMTGARAGAISLIPTVGLLALTTRRKLITALLLAGAIICLWIALPQPLKDRYATIGKYESEATYQSRVQSAKLGLRMFLEHPLLGVGFGSFMVARVEEYDGIWLQPHNLYAEVSSEMGVVGLLSFVVLLLSTVLTYRAACRNLRSTGPFTVSQRWLDRICVAVPITLVALLVQGLAGHNFAALAILPGSSPGDGLSPDQL